MQEKPFYQNLKKWYQTASLPGFEGVPIQFVMRRFAEELKKDRIGPRASGIAFNFLLALFPTLIFIFSLIPYIPIEGLQETIFELMQRILPKDAFDLFQKTIKDTVTKKRVDLLSFGFLATIIFSTNGMNAILKAFAKINPVFKVRSFFKEWLVALMLTVMLSTLMIIGLILIIGGSHLIDFLIGYLNISNGVTILALNALRWFMIMSIYFFGISIIYYFGPAVHEKWKFISVGASFATILSMIATLGFTFYVENFGQYNQLYGSLGTFIVIMIWLNINSLVLLFGFELNNSIRLNKFELDN